jgi:hypothetical protein
MLTSAVVAQSTGAGLVYTSMATAPQLGNAITCIMLCNTTNSTPTTVTLYAVPSSGGTGLALGTPGAENMILHSLPMPPNETVSLDQEKLVLGPYDSIVAVCPDASTVTITVSTIPV